MMRFTAAILVLCFLSLPQIAVAQDQPELPNDPLLDSQWYLFSPDDPRGTPGSINAIEAWEHVKPAEPVTVAVLGEGLNYTHPDLADNIWMHPNEEWNRRDDDGNGFVDDVHGWDFAAKNGYPASQSYLDQEDHGSMVASVIAAVPNNGQGIAGVARNVRLMPVRVLGDGALWQRYADGIRYATKQGARVIVCTTSLSQIVQFIESALKEAEAANVLFVCSAGNRTRYNIDNDEELKPLRKFSNVLIVAGSRKDGRLAPLSFGSMAQVAAPCDDMKLLSFNDYVPVPHMGTSWAAPIAAAVAATFISQEPDLTPQQVIDRIRRCSVPHETMNGKIAGGRIDMLRVIANNAVE